eukprot:CAMPEP_0115550750 /NCGR_PEP_ID=MMETSP0271-20121206/95382_1 /TAXON_ID=71861 /ORGANISM="Scrippsiella trochoidea, Strain CCMP3099" /LENGTH=33 /DNA_ID= /DNA_START= /DNA_END= /DNA_ORIENTATION=
MAICPTPMEDFAKAPAADAVSACYLQSPRLDMP